MVYQTIQQMNVTGIDDLLLYTQNVVPIFIPLFLLAIFIITSLGIYFGTKRNSGYGDFFTATAVGSFLTTIIAILMTLKDGLINVYTLAACIVVTFLCILGLFFNRGER